MLISKSREPGTSLRDIFGRRLDLSIDPTKNADAETTEMERSFRAFARQALQIVVPQEIIWNWHIDAVCDHLQAVTEGQIQNLIINVPPRCLKSSLASVCWTAWEWIRNPRLRYIFTAYDLNLSQRDNLACKDLIKSPWYQERWSPIYRIRPDIDAKKLFSNTSGGRRLATSVTSGNTGEGGDRIVVDDPHNVQKSESETKRQEVITWWTRTMSTRINSAKASKVIIGQRVHHKDLTGVTMQMMKDGGERYELLILPMEYEPKLMVEMASLLPDPPPSEADDEDEDDSYDPRGMVIGQRLDKLDRPTAIIPRQTVIGFKDPRETPGELLTSEQWSQKLVDQWRFTMGPYQYSAQFQQAPSPAEGGQFKERYWQRYSYMPLWHRGLRPQIIAVDSSYGTEDGDFTGVSVWGTVAGRLYVMDAKEWREETPILRRRLRDLYAKWQVPFLIEKKANGIPLIQDLRRGSEDGSLPSLPVIEFSPDGMDKEGRAFSVVSYVAGGLVYLPDDADWVDGWITQHSQFPKGTNDDLVDTSSMAITWLAKRTSAIRELFEQPVPAPYEMRALAPTAKSSGFYTR